MSLLIPVSPGELLDKMTILRIKRTRIDDVKKLKNIKKELHQLETVVTRELPTHAEIDSLVVELQKVNEELWEIEDAIRGFERDKDFGEAFVTCARAVYQTNDRRAGLKYRINELLGSELIEEKSYQPY